MILILTLSAMFPPGGSSITQVNFYFPGSFHSGILGQCVPPGGAHEAHLLSFACLAGYEVQCAFIEQTKT